MRLSSGATQVAANSEPAAIAECKKGQDCTMAAKRAARGQDDDVLAVAVPRAIVEPFADSPLRILDSRSNLHLITDLISEPGDAFALAVMTALTTI